ncbi:MAG: flagellar FliJ family protein [Sphingomonadales bacterium]
MTQGLRNLIRLHRWQLEESRQKLGQLEGLRAELERNAENLEAEIKEEQQKASGDLHFAYGPYATAAIGRRETIVKSLQEIDQELAKARDEVADAFMEVKKFEIAQEREQKRATLAAQRKEQQTLDDLSLDMFRRRQAR